MKYHQLGKNGITVSHLGLGTRFLPVDDKGAVVYDQAVRIIRKALDLGVNVIDTSPNYNSGGSEIAIGTAIKGYDRSKIYISTKNPVKRPLDPEETWRSRLEQSLERMRTDYVDFYLVEALCLDTFVRTVPLFLKEARKLKEQGLIRQLGFSTFDVEENVMEFINSDEFAFIMVPFNLTDSRYVRILEQARAKGIGTIIMCPLGGGMHMHPHDVLALLGADRIGR